MYRHLYSLTASNACLRSDKHKIVVAEAGMISLAPNGKGITSAAHTIKINPPHKHTTERTIFNVKDLRLR